MANIHAAVGHDVTRLTYLGDWGTQFGHLLAGLDRFNVQVDDSAEDPLRTLLDVYVRANQEAAIDPTLESAARTAFAQLEAGEPNQIARWAACRRLSIDALTATYARLNIRFDAYDGESMYRTSDASKAVLDDMRAKGLLRLAADGRQVVDITDDLAVTVVKSDGSSLYMSRDIAAALDRRQRYSFERMFYVVDNSQAIHFTNLFQILTKAGGLFYVEFRYSDNFFLLPKIK